jgi:hypothetical protein
MGTKELQRFVDNKSLVALRKFAAAEAQLKELKEKHDEVIEQIRAAMVENGVTRLEGDWGYITLAERTNYSIKNLADLDPKYTKLSLDSTKVKAQAVLTGELPAGVAEKKTQYITKKLKAV